MPIENIQTGHACMVRSVYIESDRANARQPRKSLIFLASLQSKTHDIIILSEKNIFVNKIVEEKAGKSGGI